MSQYVTGLRQLFLDRAADRGYTWDEIKACVISTQGSTVTVDTAHPAYPHEPRINSPLNAGDNLPGVKGSPGWYAHYIAYWDKLSRKHVVRGLGVHHVSMKTLPPIVGGWFAIVPGDATDVMCWLMYTRVTDKDSPAPPLPKSPTFVPHV